jgi:hypothetical protein
VGPAQNPLLAGIRPGVMGPHTLTIRPGGQVVMQAIAFQAAVDPLSTTALSQLWPAAPNPARRTTRLRFTLPARGDIALAIHDLSGRQVRTLAEGGHAAGETSVAWDLRDDTGRDVPAGLYFVRMLRNGQPGSVQRVVVLR